MTADRLRAAAQKIRDTANAANFDPQWQLSDDLVAFGFDSEDANQIALWSPPVALAVADWLDVCADDPSVEVVDPGPSAIAVADLILGGAS